MRWTWTLALLLPILSCGGGGGDDGEDPAVLPLHLLVPAADLDARVLPARLEPLPDAVEDHVTATGREVVVDRLSPADYEHDLRIYLGGAPHPDLVWVPATLIAYLVDAAWIVPLEDRIAADPDVLLGTEPWMQEMYEHEGHTWAVPVGEKGHHSGMGYAITAAAAERGHVSAAFDLLRHLRERIPLRGLCDVALDEIEITVEDAGGGGDVIDETHYLDAQVRNLGDVPVENVRVVVEADGLGVIDDVMIPWIESRDQVPLRVDLGSPAPGLYRLQARVDPDDVVPELNDLNNQDEIDWAYQHNAGGTGPTQVKALSSAIAIDGAAYNASITGMNPKVAFDGTNYLVVYAKQDTLSKTAFQYKILARRVSPAGVLLGTAPTVVASKKARYSSIDVVFGGSQYLVVWEESFDSWPLQDPLSRIDGARLSVSGALLDSTPITIDASPDPSDQYVLHERPCVFWDGSHFVVVYRDIPNTGNVPSSATQFGIYARRVSATGQVQSGKPKLQSISNTFYAAHVQEVAFAAGAGLVIFEGNTPTTRGIYGRHFTSSGGDPTPSATPLVVFHSTTDFSEWISWPCVAVSAQSKYLGVWCPRVSTGSGKFYRADLATVGGPGSTPTSRGPIATKAGDEFPAVAHGGAAYTIVTRHHVGCHSYVGAFRMSHAGTWAPGATLSGHNLIGQVDVAFGVTNGLVAYVNQKPPSTYNGPDTWLGVYVRLIDKSQ